MFIKSVSTQNKVCQNDQNKFDNNVNNHSNTGLLPGKFHFTTQNYLLLFDCISFLVDVNTLLLYVYISKMFLFQSVQKTNI